MPRRGRDRARTTSMRWRTRSTRRWPSRRRTWASIDPWDHLRRTYAERRRSFLATALPGLEPRAGPFRPHHVAHAASAGARRADRRGRPAACSCSTAAGSGEPPGRPLRGRRARAAAAQAAAPLAGPALRVAHRAPGFLRSSDEYKVMALASYGGRSPRRRCARPSGPTRRRRVRAPQRRLDALRAAPVGGEDDWRAAHADLACSVQARLEEVLVELATWLHDRTGDRVLTMAGGTALNCVANTRIWRETAFEEVWVQPAAGDAGTALGAALQVSRRRGAAAEPMARRRSGRQWRDDELAAWLRRAAVPFTTPGRPRRRGRRRPRRQTASSRGSTAAASSARAPSATGPCWRTRAGPRTSSGSTTSRAASSSARSRRWCCSSGPPRSSSTGRFPSPYMLFVHRVAPGLAGPHPRSRPRRRHRAHADRRRRDDAEPWRPLLRGLRGADRAARRRSTPA